MKKALFLLFFLSGSLSLMAQDWDAFIEAYMGTNADADTLQLDGDDSLEIAEASFRYIFAHNRGVKPRKSKYYILSFLHCAQHLSLDPEAPLMASLSDIRPKVRGHMFYFKNKRKLYDKVMFFFITDMAMTGPNTAEVRIGYYQNDEVCAGHIYTFKRVNGYWELKRSVIEWQR